MMRRQFGSALACYNEGLGYFPTNPELKRGRAVVFLQLKHNTEAIKDYSDVITADPKDPSNYNHRARAYMFMEQYDLAIKDYSSAIRLEQPIFTQWSALMKKHDTEAVGELLEKYRLFSISRDFPMLYVSRAEGYIKLKDFDKAKVDLATAASFEGVPKSSIHDLQGEILAGKHDYAQALKEYKSALQLDSNDLNALLGMAAAQEKLNDNKSALENYGKFIKRVPRASKLYVLRAALYEKMGNHDLAAKDLLKAKQLDEKNKSTAGQPPAPNRSTTPNK
jgi:tetratricopeptide (TPR) repeat protein